jgi:hypothetical protein
LYQDAVNLCRAGEDEEKWQRAIYWVFDAPGLDMVFEVTQIAALPVLILL